MVAGDFKGNDDVGANAMAREHLCGHGNALDPSLWRRVNHMASIRSGDMAWARGRKPASPTSAGAPRRPDARTGLFSLLPVTAPFFGHLNKHIRTAHEILRHVH